MKKRNKNEELIFKVTKLIEEIRKDSLANYYEMKKNHDDSLKKLEAIESELRFTKIQLSELQMRSFTQWGDA